MNKWLCLPSLNLSCLMLGYAIRYRVPLGTTMQCSILSVNIFCPHIKPSPFSLIRGQQPCKVDQQINSNVCTFHDTDRSLLPCIGFYNLSFVYYVFCFSKFYIEACLYFNIIILFDFQSYIY